MTAYAFYLLLKIFVMFFFSVLINDTRRKKPSGQRQKTRRRWSYQTGDDPRPPHLPTTLPFSSKANAV